MNEMKVQLLRPKTDLKPAWSNTPCKQIQALSEIKTLKTLTSTALLDKFMSQG